MNCYAARDLGFPYPYPCSVVLIEAGQSRCKVVETARHEEIEAEIMRVLKVPYSRAHSMTTRIERIGGRSC